MIHYRDATPADAATLAAIGERTFVTTFGHLYSARDLALFLAANHSPEAAARYLTAPDHATRFADEGGATVAYAMVCPANLPHLAPDRTALELKRLYLLPSHFGHGVADALMDWTLDHAARAGAHDVALSVFSDNPRAIAFYRRHGFQPVGQYKFPVGDQLDDEFVYVRPL